MENNVKNPINFGVEPGVSYLTVEDKICTIWGVKPIQDKTCYVLSPEHRNNEFSSVMLFRNLAVADVNIMVGLLETFNDNINRDLKGMYKITIEKIE